MSLSPALKKAKKIELSVNIDDDANLTLLLKRGNNSALIIGLIFTFVFISTVSYNYFFSFSDISNYFSSKKYSASLQEKEINHSIINTQAPKLTLLSEKRISQETNTSNITQPYPTDFSSNFLRAQLTKGINNLEPIDNIFDTVVSDEEGNGKIYFFTQLINLKGQKITHQWYFEGELRSQLAFNVKGNRWRVNSRMRFNHGSEGDWEVVVINEAGDEMLSRNFYYQVR